MLFALIIKISILSHIAKKTSKVATPYITTEAVKYQYKTLTILAIFCDGL